MERFSLFLGFFAPSMIKSGSSMDDRVRDAANNVILAGRWPLLKDVLETVGGNKAACGKAYKAWIEQSVEGLKTRLLADAHPSDSVVQQLQGQLKESRLTLEKLTGVLAGVTASNADHLERLENFLHRNTADMRALESRAQENETRKLKARNDELSLEVRRLQSRIDQYRSYVASLGVDDPF